jgi:enoyl-CoA hydratase/carnithine racemase
VTDLVTYDYDDGVATITLDDGKVNVLSPAMLAGVNGALDRAQAAGAVVVLSGRPGIFSAGFDLDVLRGGGDAGLGMVRDGFELGVRLLSFPRPVVLACTGHAIAMGSFLLLCADYRVGAAGAFKFQANEVAIGLALPRTAIEICRQRLTPAHLHRVIALSEVYGPDNAVEAGWLDRVVDAGDLAKVAADTARALATLDAEAHTIAKEREREGALALIRATFDQDYAALTTTRVD